jgi:hypothetical protein
LGLIVLTLGRENALITNKIRLIWLDDVERRHKLNAFRNCRKIIIFLNVFFLKALSRFSSLLLDLKQIIVARDVNKIT